MMSNLSDDFLLRSSRAFFENGTSLNPSKYKISAFVAYLVKAHQSPANMEAAVAALDKPALFDSYLEECKTESDIIEGQKREDIENTLIRQMLERYERLANPINELLNRQEASKVGIGAVEELLECLQKQQMDSIEIIVSYLSKAVSKISSDLAIANEKLSLSTENEKVLKTELAEAKQREMNAQEIGDYRYKVGTVLALVGLVFSVVGLLPIVLKDEPSSAKPNQEAKRVIRSGHQHETLRQMGKSHLGDHEKRERRIIKVFRQRPGQSQEQPRLKGLPDTKKKSDTREIFSDFRDSMTSIFLYPQLRIRPVRRQGSHFFRKQHRPST